MTSATLTRMLLYSGILTAVVSTVLLYAVVRVVSYRPLRDAGLKGMALAAKE